MNVIILRQLQNGNNNNRCTTAPHFPLPQSQVLMCQLSLSLPICDVSLFFHKYKNCEWGLNSGSSLLSGFITVIASQLHHNAGRIQGDLEENLTDPYSGIECQTKDPCASSSTPLSHWGLFIMNSYFTITTFFNFV